jgi:DNA-binding NarL/FixJ family response regulator
MTTADDAREFTEQEFLFIIGACSGLPNREIAKRCEISEEIVMTAMYSVFDKSNVSTRAELVVFAMAALNNELRRRLGDSSEPR